jgi:hypothetical protein
LLRKIWESIRLCHKKGGLGACSGQRDPFAAALVRVSPLLIGRSKACPLNGKKLIASP